MKNLIEINIWIIALVFIGSFSLVIVLSQLKCLLMSSVVTLSEPDSLSDSSDDYEAPDTYNLSAHRMNTPERVSKS